MRRVGYVDHRACIGEPAEDRGPEMGDKGVDIATTATIEAFASVDSGKERKTFIGQNVWLMKHVHVGHDATICHDCELAPGVVIGGHCWVGGRVKIGVGAVLRPYINVGPGSRIGAGAVVVKDVEPNTVVAGNPARVLEVPQ